MKVYCGECQHYKKYMFLGGQTADHGSPHWVGSIGCLEPSNAKTKEWDDYEKHHEESQPKQDAELINKYNNCSRFKRREA